MKRRHRQADVFDVEFDIDVMGAKQLTRIGDGAACPSVETVDRVKA